MESRAVMALLFVFVERVAVFVALAASRACAPMR